MPNPRLNPLLGGTLAGLSLGALAWLLLSGMVVSKPLGRMEEAIASARGAAPVRERPTAGQVDELAASPIFALTTGPGAVTEVALRLQGLSRSPRNKGALLAIGDQPAEWLRLGETRNDVTLVEVGPSAVVVDTATGLKEVSLWETVQGAASEAAAPETPVVDGPMELPRGVRMPLPPADAPSQ